MPKNVSAYASVTATKVVVLSSASDSINCTGGVSIGGDLVVLGSITGGSIVYASTSTGTLSVTDATGQTTVIDSTEESTSVGSGAFYCTGGGSFGGNLYVGGTLVAGSVTYASTSTGTMTITNSPGNTLIVSSSEASTSVSTGATTIVGGMGVGGAVNTNTLKVWDTTQSTSTTTGCSVFSGGIGIAGNSYVGGTGYVGDFVVNSTTDSTSPSTGAAKILGGVGITKALFVGTTIAAIGEVTCGGFNFILGNTDQVTNGNSGSSRALRKDTGNILSINHLGDYTGGSSIGGTVNLLASTTPAILKTEGLAALRKESGASRLLINPTGDFVLGVDINGALSVDAVTASGAISTTQLTTSGNITCNGTDIALGGLRALVKDTTKLDINYSGDFTGGTTVGGSLDLLSSTTPATLFIETRAAMKKDASTELLVINPSSAFALGVDIIGPLAVDAVTSSSTISCTQLTTSGNITCNGTDIALGGLRALVKDTTVLAVNYLGDYTGGTSVGGTLNLLASTTPAILKIESKNAIRKDAVSDLLVINEGSAFALGVDIVGNLAVDTVVSSANISCVELTTSGNITCNGTDFALGGGRALVKDGGRIVLNYANDFVDGVRVDGSIDFVTGLLPPKISIEGLRSFSKNGTVLALNEFGDFTATQVYGDAIVSGTTESTSTTTGAITTPGGLGVAKNINGGQAISALGSVTSGGFDFILGNTDQSSRGDSGSSRALVKNTGNVLVINFQNDFSGGTKVESDLRVTGDSIFEQTIESSNFWSASQTSSIVNDNDPNMASKVCVASKTYSGSALRVSCRGSFQNNGGLGYVRIQLTDVISPSYGGTGPDYISGTSWMTITAYDTMHYWLPFGVRSGRDYLIYFIQNIPSTLSDPASSEYGGSLGDYPVGPYTFA